MIVLVLNCGSSSIKYQLMDMDNVENPNVKALGLVERIGLNDGILTHKPQTEGAEKYKITEDIPNHVVGINLILKALTDKEHGVINDVHEIEAVGHRVTHGGEAFTQSVIITPEVKQKIQDVSDLAPLHNPANLAGIKAMEELLPNVPQAAVFDTSFHQTMPAKSYLYAIPYEYYDKYKIRRYGFHGTSHKYVSKQACKECGLDFNNSKIITCHLGNGASITAIKDGKSYDTSMGFTPVEGLVMGTRVGNIDLGALLFLMEKENLDIHQINDVMNKKSGVLGLSGVSSDMRDVEEAGWKKHEERAEVALEVYHQRIRHYVGAYAAEMGGVDLIVFTGGVGENGPETRQLVCENMEYLGLEFDNEANDGVRGKVKTISKPNSKVKVMIYPTNEERVIATDTVNLIKGNN